MNAYSGAVALGREQVAAYIKSMGEVINLRRTRKGKARVEAERKAAENRAAFGRSKAEKKLTKTEQEAAARKLDGHRYDDDAAHSSDGRGCHGQGGDDQ